MAVTQSLQSTLLSAITKLLHILRRHLTSVSHANEITHCNNHCLHGVVPQGHTEELWGLTPHPSHHQFLTAGYDRTCYLWDTMAHTIVWSKDIGVKLPILVFSEVSFYNKSNSKEVAVRENIPIPAV